jgi:hypothetical protein
MDQGLVARKVGGIPNEKCLACGQPCTPPHIIDSDGIESWFYSDLL